MKIPFVLKKVRRRTKSVKYIFLFHLSLQKSVCQQKNEQKRVNSSVILILKKERKTMAPGHLFPILFFLIVQNYQITRITRKLGPVTGTEGSELEINIIT
jgi:hypothetical protein